MHSSRSMLGSFPSCTWLSMAHKQKHSATARGDICAPCRDAVPAEQLPDADPAAFRQALLPGHGSLPRPRHRQHCGATDETRSPANMLPYSSAAIVMSYAAVMPVASAGFRRKQQHLGATGAARPP